MGLSRLARARKEGKNGAGGRGRGGEETGTSTPGSRAFVAFLSRR